MRFSVWIAGDLMSFKLQITYNPWDDVKVGANVVAVHRPTGIVIQEKSDYLPDKKEWIDAMTIHELDFYFVKEETNVTP